MNPASIASFASKAAGEIADSLGTPITIGGQTFNAFVSTPAPQMNLEMGGFNTNRSIRLRWPIGRYIKPTLGTSVLLVNQNLTFRVETAEVGNGALGAQVLVTAIRE
jgi:hypothetical protein